MKTNKQISIPKTQIRFVVDRYYQTQEHRIALQGQIRAIRELKEDTTVLEGYFKQFYAIEKGIAKDLKHYFEEQPMCGWLKKCKGIGPVFGSVLMALIDVEKAQHISSIWEYCGLDPNQKRIKGQKINYNPFLKKTCWLIGKSFIKSKGRYRKLYDQYKEDYKKKFPNEVEIKDKNGKKIKTNYTKGHLDSMARRKAVKMFLSDYWVENRRQLGLPLTPPYPHKDDKNFYFKKA